MILINQKYMRRLSPSMDIHLPAISHKTVELDIRLSIVGWTRSSADPSTRQIERRIVKSISCVQLEIHSEQ
jgi:hypothetical protein